MKIIYTDLFQVNIVSQLHVFSMNLENLQSSSGIRDANVHFPIKTPCTWWKDQTHTNDFSKSELCFAQSILLSRVVQVVQWSVQ